MTIASIQNHAVDTPDSVRTIARFLDVATGATGRATFYNSADEQAALERAAHADMAALDRRAYTGLICGPYVLDRARQTGVVQLLSTPSVDPVGEASDALVRAVARLSVPRMLNLYAMLAAGRVNNARARKLILRTILGSPALERWSVRYRRKLAAALRHAWGARRVGILRSILVRERAGEELEPKELRLLAAEIDRFAQGRSRAVVHECVAFVLGAPGPYTRPLLRAYTDARTDFDAGRVLPYETLEGLRGRFHPNEPAARVLELTKSRLTAGQRLAKQEQAERAGVEVDVDFTRYDAVRLYLYAFRRGMTDEVARALASRARQAAASLDLGYRNVALLLDGSASMAGADEQALRPIAVTLALRDAFRAAGGGNADSSVTETWFGGRPDNGGLVHPAGATAPAEALIEALAQGPDIVVVVSDGYENAPAGRFAETLAAVRGFGIRTPVVQLAPVLAAESGGVRPLADEVPVAALQRLEGLELLACRLVLDAEPEVGLRMLDRIAAAGGEPGRREVGAADVGDDSRSVPAAVPRSVFEAMPENPSESAPEEVSS